MPKKPGRAAPSAPGPAPLPLSCPLDAGVLDPRGWCARGQGFTLLLAAPPGPPCPICRGPLAWSGGCYQCYGSRTPADRTTWTFPGQPYALVSGHYRPEGAAGQRVVSATVVAADAAQLRQRLIRIGAERLTKREDEKLTEIAAPPAEPAWITADWPDGGEAGA